MAVAPRVAAPGHGEVSRARRRPRVFSTAERVAPVFVPELACECGRLDCRERLPVVAERHRGIGRLLVAPEHLNGELVVRAADRFFVVEARH